MPLCFSLLLFAVLFAFAYLFWFAFAAALLSAVAFVSAVTFTFLMWLLLFATSYVVVAVGFSTFLLFDVVCVCSYCFAFRFCVFLVLFDFAFCRVCVFVFLFFYRFCFRFSLSLLIFDVVRGRSWASLGPLGALFAAFGRSYRPKSIPRAAKSSPREP